jgi:Hypothetical protein (DUF2513)
MPIAWYPDGMKRDMDLVRQILLHLEAEQTDMTAAGTLKLEGFQREAVAHHLTLLESAGYINIIKRTKFSKVVDASYLQTVGYQLTWDGHEFIETIRDPEIWRKTKDGATAVGGWTVSLLAELGKGYLNAKAIELGLPIA